MSTRGRGHDREVQLPQTGQPMSEAGTSDPTRVTKRRGKTRGIALANKRSSGQKLDVIIPPHLMRAVGNNAQALITELGIIVRMMAPLQFPKWKAIPENDKLKMWLATKQKFTLQDNPYIQEAIYQQLNRQLRSYRSKLHKKYYCKYITDEMRLHNTPPGVDDVDWAKLVEYFGSPDFKKISERNKLNRKRQKIAHVAGTKAFSRISYDKRDCETGDEPTRTEMWYNTRFSKEKKVWVNSASQEVYDELKRLECQPLEEGVAPMTENERFEKVLGPERSGYIRGRGAGPKPTTSASGQRIRAQLERENEEYKRQLEDSNRRYEEVSTRLETVESQIASQVETQVQSAVQSQLANILQQFRDSGGTLTPPLS